MENNIEYTIVPIQEDHIPGFRYAVDCVAKERKYLARLEAPPIEKSTSFIKDSLQNDIPFFVGIANEKIIGWCDIVPLSNHATHRHTGVLGIGLVQGFRGYGIGTALIAKTLDKALAQGLTRIELTVRENNTAAIHCYKKFGFEIEGIKRNAIYLDGVHENVCSMAFLKETS